MNPNHYLAVAICVSVPQPARLAQRRGRGQDAGLQLDDRPGGRVDLGRRLCEVPVGFKWFVDGLLDGSYGFGGEESAGASFLRRDGTVWTTDKDGIIMDLLAAEITAITGKDPGEHYRELEARFGSPVYERMDAPADARAEEGAGQSLARHGHGHGAGRRADHRQADPRAGKRRGASAGSRS